MFSSGNKRDQGTGGKSLWRRLGRAIKLGLTYDLNDLFSRHKTIDSELVEEIETLLITSDVGVDATQQIIGGLNQRLVKNQLADVNAVQEALRDDMLAILQPVAQPLSLSALTSAAPTTSDNANFSWWLLRMGRSSPSVVGSNHDSPLAFLKIP